LICEKIVIIRDRFHAGKNVVFFQDMEKRGQKGAKMFPAVGGGAFVQKYFTKWGGICGIKRGTRQDGREKRHDHH
jgi:hypothetical protein